MVTQNGGNSDMNPPAAGLNVLHLNVPNFLHQPAVGPRHLLLIFVSFLGRWWSMWILDDFLPI
jgi:hypothetical protein